jgi:hypothetical protein
MWEDGTPIELEGHIYSEARHDAAHDVILLRKGEGLVTGLRAEGEVFSEIKPKMTCPACGTHQLNPKPGATCTGCRNSVTDWID